jgi:aspartyl-tRNA(Asn)/glutamyl-tRNA(Gln) amidotransferase subunit C
MPNETKKIDVRYVADLARLQLTDEERDVLQAQLDEIVAYVDQLAELDVDGIEPTAHAAAMTNVLRPDEAVRCALRDAFLDNAPQTGDGLIVTPKVVE